MEVRQELVQVVASAKGCGIAHYQSCEVLQIQVRRVERWAVRLKHRGTMAYRKPGPRQVVHAILPAERAAVVAFVGREETVDYSLQLLAIKGGEQGLCFLSASSVRAILQKQGLGEDWRSRGKGRFGAMPNRLDELTGPNQCWCWDISYLKTYILRVFWYLYVVIDEWIRKVIARLQL